MRARGEGGKRREEEKGRGGEKRREGKRGALESSSGAVLWVVWLMLWGLVVYL